ncbi:hypothetical protein FOB84_21005 [Gordonia bronchialis]|uniref:helix-turn-helix domain-containing protein n=1 Tax=Gordonia bronchialis TaxID=2054 RepID=UPI0011C0670F|nr:helix-turn-helix domain-containing protein [Gordonia bronchialis]MCC3322668.1 helix-turn-helix domain-containing protein [Gordonia bronchialis]QGS26237.1 hypothetical protein FOB84_21005 [Gordonia bronchialis]
MPAVFESIAITADPGYRPVAHYIALPGAPCRATVLRAIRSGRLPAVFVSTGWRVTEADWAAWMAGRCRPSIPPTVPSEVDAAVAALVAAAPPLTDAQIGVVARAVGDGLRATHRRDYDQDHTGVSARASEA